MRRWAAALTALGALVALAGCAGLPAGVDGNLTNNWPAMPEAKVAVPLAGACYTGQYVYPGRSVRVWTGDFNPVDCATTHYSETAFVGTFTGADAQRSTTPDIDGPAMPGIYDQCRKEAATYLGGDVDTALIWLQLQVPTNAAWRGGARWFRCDLVRLTDPFGTAWVDHGSVKGDLSGQRTSAYGCLVTTEEKDRTITDAKPIDCAQPHAAEFAGVFTAPNVPYPTDKTTRDRMLDAGCEAVVATFLGYSSVNEWRNAAVGWWELNWSEDQWKLGDRTTQCFAYAYTKSGKFVGSVKGIRNQTPKG
jgi:Septum formation